MGSARSGYGYDDGILGFVSWFPLELELDDGGGVEEAEDGGVEPSEDDEDDVDDAEDEDDEDEDGEDDSPPSSTTSSLSLLLFPGFTLPPSFPPPPPSSPPSPSPSPSSPVFELTHLGCDRTCVAANAPPERYRRGVDVDVEDAVSCVLRADAVHNGVGVENSLLVLASSDMASANPSEGKREREEREEKRVAVYSSLAGVVDKTDARVEEDTETVTPEKSTLAGV
ncbi:hypothetical protein CC1G_09070 [Coprinopsis cinerea okayama7|uniref:Uncharacterized protein n=1 Tax=Coprinopsis cinerea (strain Okayama-7 / 130 / ATCC MYA-4618 / FGSC 9003) TaxID=240176 RepID=A8P309_COPC7|nr:hypothetical protein CC1G_09070 [Coprinopsis cinerea okayama7\|eukprot:XP_001838442.1 hypothetical protein CC1G_09070 [Coprinopsis cinerea okayama7\